MTLFCCLSIRVLNFVLFTNEWEEEWNLGINPIYILQENAIPIKTIELETIE